MLGKKVFIAARYSRRKEMQQVALWLRSYGYTVTSRWLAGNTKYNKRRRAQMDLIDCRASDWMLAFSEYGPSTHNARLTELGIFIGEQKPIHVIGPKEHTYFHLPEVQVHDTLYDMRRDAIGNGL